MSDTPRTDKYIGHDNEDYMTEGEIAMREFARQLERKLTAAGIALNAERAQSANQMLVIDSMTQNLKAEKERAEMFKDQREKLIEAMKAHLPFIPNMEPIGAAAQSESNRTAWNLRKTLEEMKGLKQ